MKRVFRHGLTSVLLAVAASLAMLAAWLLPPTTKALHESPWFETLCERISCPPVAGADTAHSFVQIEKLRMIARSEEMSLIASLVNLHDKKQPFPVLDVQLFSAENKLQKRFWIDPALYLQTKEGNDGMLPGEEYPVLATVPHSDDAIFWYKVLTKKGFPSLRAPVDDTQKKALP